ncbi:MAG: NapC/NirT family cytochrome c [Anaerolineae bacterium]
MAWFQRLIPRRGETLSIRHFLMVGLLLVGIGVFMLVAPPIWEYTNSTGFCGTTCHTMPPEYATFLVSPHSRVTCVDCHIGRDLLLVQFFRKSGHMRLIVDTILENYELPIRATTMSPARQTCEMCHAPETFADDSLQVINTFDNNRTNDPYSIYLLMHTGGGSQRQGLGRGIHWHIENPITYIALDAEQQEIPWVRVEMASGEVVEYNAINSPIDTENLGQYEIREMDCITCHNRIAHDVEPPNRAVDEALRAGDISRDIPFIRVRAIELLGATYSTTEEALQAFQSLDPYYSQNYPEFYAQGQQLVSEAIAMLSQLYQESNYPEQLLSWDTHPNNVGHLNSAGCFRCHDGEHFSDTGEVVRLECNLCHTIPAVVRPGEIEPSLPLTTGIEPSTHLDSTWISRHPTAFDASCSNCHTTANPGGIDNQSFCSNSACHGSSWEFAGFNAPGLATILGIYQVTAPPLLEDFNGEPTYAILQPFFTQQCGACHGAVPTNGLRLTDYDSLIAGSVNGPVVVSGSPDESRMIQVLSDGHFAQVTDHQLELLTRWIEGGLQP